LQHIITDCQQRDKKDITTEEAQEESEKRSAQSQMPKIVKEVMGHMNKYTWDSIEAENKGIALGEQNWDDTQTHKSNWRKPCNRAGQEQ
jgi:hypothetical protein